MTTAVPRHVDTPGNAEKHITALSKSINNFFESLDQATTITELIAQDSLERTQWQLLIDPTAEQVPTYSSLLISARAGAAFFKAATTTQDRFDYLLRTPITLDATGPTHSHTPAMWLDALATAIICRTQGLVADICEYPTNLLQGNFDDYIFAWVDALKAFFTGDDDLYPKINRSIELTDPEQLPGLPGEIALHRYYPSMKLLFNLAAGNAQAFNEDLHEALQLHRRFWTANEERISLPSGFFALMPTALAAVAHDQGIPIEVESDYLPRNFVTNYWVQQSREDLQQS